MLVVLAIDRNPEWRPRWGLETTVVEELKQIVERLPKGTAELEFSRVGPPPGEPCFEVRPTNPRAAGFSAVVIANDDLEITIGKAAFREFCCFARGGKVIAGHSAAEEFRSLVHAVMKGGFTEEIYYNSSGKLIRSELRIRIGSTDILFVYRNWFRIPFLKRRKETITYDPYLL